MNPIKNWQNIIESIRNMSYKDLEGWKYLLMILIIADLFGVYWYLGAKKLGVALMLVLIGVLTFILIVGGDKQPPKKKEVKNKMDEENKKQKEEQEEETIDSDLGLPDADDYQKRLDKALGTPEDFGL
jgi:hypothetical protein